MREHLSPERQLVIRDAAEAWRRSAFRMAREVMVIELVDELDLLGYELRDAKLQIRALESDLYGE